MAHLKAGEKVKIDFAKLSNKNSVLSLGYLSKKSTNSYSDPAQIERALNNNDLAFLRNASNFFYQTNGIYSRLVRYASNLLTFDHIIYPILPPGKKPTAKTEKLFYEAVYLLEGLNVKRTGREIAHSIIKNGVYYGYVHTNAKQFVVQDLPIDYCRVVRRFNNIDLVEFDVSYFDNQIRDAALREQVLATFPKELKAGYLAYKAGRLEKDPVDKKVWVPTELGKGVKFSLLGSELPLFVQVLTDIIDLEQAKDIQKQKSLQEIAKVVVQQMPLTDDYEMVFDMEEAAVMHNNVVSMLKDTVGVDVLTTFADVDLLSVVDKANNGNFDGVAGARNTVYAEAGVSEQLFATDGNLALEKSILSDEAILYGVLDDVESWLTELLRKYGPSGIEFAVCMPRVTIFSAQKAVELYKGLATVGYSKMLPGIVSGQSQLSILSTMKFENEILGLPEKMTPLQMSSTQSSSSSSANSGSKAGRPTKPDDEKSEKTIANITSAS